MIHFGEFPHFYEVIGFRITNLFTIVIEIPSVYNTPPYKNYTGLEQIFSYTIVGKRFSS